VTDEELEQSWLDYLDDVEQSSVAIEKQQAARFEEWLAFPGNR
jgi:hypothetical protein